MVHARVDPALMVSIPLSQQMSFHSEIRSLSKMPRLIPNSPTVSYSGMWRTPPSG